MRHEINLYGASGHAKVIKEIVEACGDIVGCLYDDAPQSDTLHGKNVVKASDTEVKGPLIISIGSNRARKLISGKHRVRYARAIHPAAVVSPTAAIGEGTVIMPGAVIQADARIGSHCIINTGATVDHDCVVGDFSHISPNASLCGNVTVGEGAWIGAGATVIPGITIGPWAIIGAGATVLCDIPTGTIAVGSPAKVIRQNDIHANSDHN